MWHEALRARPLNLLAALSRGDAPGGWLPARGGVGLLWVVIMTATWLLPNDTNVFVRVGLTVWTSLFCGGIPVATYYRERTALREHRRDNGLCPACGYDLRATPGKCPECGTSAAPPT